MAKRKQSADTGAQLDTKKAKQVSKGKASGAKPGANKYPDNDIEDEEQIKRKVKPKPCSSSKPKGGSTIATTTSKYFTSPRKEEPESDDDDVVMVSMVPPTVTRAPLRPVKKEEKEEEEGGSEEESEEDDWEEVEELDGPLGPVEPPELALPSEPVQIEIETPDLIRKKQKHEKRKAEFETYLRRMVNRFNKDVLLDTHKVHLMCLIANGMVRSRLCCEPDLLAITLSLLPTHFAMVAKQRIDHKYLSGLLKWFGATFTLNPSLPYEERPDPRALLERRLGSLSARDHREMTHLFLLVLRSLQLFCRLVLSLQPISLKLPPVKGTGAKAGGAKKPPDGKTSKDNRPSEPKVSPGTKRPAAEGRTKGGRGGKKAKRKEMKEEEGEEEEEKKSTPTGGQKPKNAQRRSVASKVSYKEESDSTGEELSEGEEFQAAGEEEESEDSEGESGGKGKNKVKANKNSINEATKRKSAGGDGGGKKKQQKKNQEEDDEDWEEVVEVEEEGESSKRPKRGSRKKRECPGADEWLEVYVEKTSSWLCMDVERGVGRPQLCAKNATAPLTYVVSVDDAGHLKDLGRKYDPTWMTTSRKRRVDEDWWGDALGPFLGPEDEKAKREEKELQARLLDKPMPTAVAEYKNHPLYALKRHMLKYEAIYPSTATTLGYCKGEPVYSRDCVHTLHSKDTWLKQARTVRLGEVPYKLVRGFSNRSRKARMSSEQKEVNDLPLFGEWQTEEYQPPIAVDGKVPRNDYGNVYLFKPCMLPVGCVHVRLPGLNRVARKLCMDAAPAVTGFDFHGGYSHAVTDGYVVCEEHEEVLRAAWVEDQEIQRQKEVEKREKRVVSNWTLLTRGLLIRERLKQRYGLKQPGPGGAGVSGQTRTRDGALVGGLSSDEEEEEKKEGAGGEVAKTAAETLAMSWPQNRQTEDQDGGNGGRLKRKTTTNREKRGQEKHLFPFEKA